MSAIPRLPRSFFERPVIEVAPDLLGTTIEHAGVRLRITEVEAYAGQLDPGSHAFRGPTPRTEVMFGPAGHLYVYFSYGMHWCANLVCGPDGEASAVLVRAGEVVSGEDLALERRLSRRPARLPVSSSTPPTGISRRDLARGPARLTTALGLDKASDGLDFCVEGSPLVFSDSLSGPVLPGRVRTGPRVGVSGAGGDGTAYPWRFWLDGESSVSPTGGTVRGLVVRPADVR